MNFSQFPNNFIIIIIILLLIFSLIALWGENLLSLNILILRHLLRISKVRYMVDFINVLYELVKFSISMNAVFCMYLLGQVY